MTTQDKILEKITRFMFPRIDVNNPSVIFVECDSQLYSPNFKEFFSSLDESLEVMLSRYKRIITSRDACVIEYFHVIRPTDFNSIMQMSYKSPHSVDPETPTVVFIDVRHILDTSPHVNLVNIPAQIQSIVDTINFKNVNCVCFLNTDTFEPAHLENINSNTEHQPNVFYLAA